MRRTNTSELLLALLLAVMLASLFCLKADRAGNLINLQPPDRPIPATFFGLHIHHLLVPPYTTWPPIPFGSWRLWDSYAAWPNLEPEKGRWDFAAPDKYLSLAEQHHAEILFPLALSPTWASARPDEKSGYSLGNAAIPENIRDWERYVRNVATRYKGRVHEYEIWNEPNLKGFYSGSIPEMVLLAKTAYKVLKSVDPTNLVISRPATGTSGLGWFDQYLRAGGGTYADVIGYHLYVNPAPPEQMVPLIRQVEHIMRKNGDGDKPLWDTETGWSIQNKEGTVKPVSGRGFNSIVLPEDTAASYLARAFILAWASGTSRLYWYSWDASNMGLVDQDGRTLKSSAIAYEQVEKWLVGTTMTSCGSDTAGTWTCSISRGGGYRGWIVWNPTATRQRVKYPIPVSLHVTRVRDLLGHAEKLTPGTTFEVSVMPHLLETVGQ